MTERLPGFAEHSDASGRRPQICSGSADLCGWGPRFLRRENHKSHKHGSALGFGSVNLRKNRRSQNWQRKRDGINISRGGHGSL